MVDFTGIRPKDGPLRVVPATQFDLDQLERVRPDKPFLVSAVFKRSLPHHRWYWGLVGVVAEAKGMSTEELHANLKFKAKLVRRILLSDAGRPFIELDSVRFSEMDETRFREYRIIATNILFRDYLDPSDKPEVWRRVEEIVGPCPW